MAAVFRLHYTAAINGERYQPFGRVHNGGSVSTGPFMFEVCDGPRERGHLFATLHGLLCMPPVVSTSLSLEMAWS